MSGKGGYKHRLRLARLRQGQKKMKAKANIDMMQWWSIVDQALTSGKLLVGDRIGVADIYMAMLTAWFEDRERLFTECRRLKSAVDIVLSESAIHDVFVANELV